MGSAPNPRPRRAGKLFVAALAIGVAGWFGGKRLVWETHLARASESLRARDFDSARHHLDWCRKARPSDRETWILSARTARRTGQFAQAEEWLVVAESLRARKHEVERERTLARAQQGFFAEVEDSLLHALENTRSDYPTIAEVLTAEYMRTYRLADAHRILDRWVELDAADLEPRLRRGWVKEHQLGYDAALEDYRHVLEREPERHPVRLQVGLILLKLNRPAEARPELERVAAATVGEPGVAIPLARSCRELGDLAAAAAALDTLTDDARRTPAALAEAAQISLAKSDFAGAEPLLRAALRDSPRERALLYSLQQCLAGLGRTAEAAEVEKQLKAVDADGRRMNELMTAMARSPGDAEMRFEVAKLFLRNGVPDDGVRWLHLTIELNPGHRGAFEELAAYHEKHGPPDRATLYRAAANALKK